MDDPWQHIQVAGSPLFGWPGALERLRSHPWRLPWAGAFAASVQRTLDRLQPLDRTIAHWIIPSAWPAALGHSPLHVVAHGSDVRLLGRLPRAVSRRILASLQVRGASFQCVSRALRSELLELCPELEPQIEVKPCAIDVAQAPTRAQARVELGVGSTPLLVVVGRLVRDKRVSLALAAGSLVPGARIAVVGDGPELPRLRKEFPEVTFVGRLPREQALTWIVASDVLLSTSRNEGAPTAVREAIALGLDVVASPAGDLEAWARHEPRLWVTRPAR